MSLPISLDLLAMRADIPVKLAELSYFDPDKTIELLQKWGEKRSPITVLHKELCDCLRNHR